MPSRLQFLVWGLKAIWLLFVFAYGACLGSLTNVIVYRMPRGISIVRPPSQCPKCGTKLSWRDNIPVLGWIALRGKCRYCKTPISPEYPIVEAAVGLLFVLFYVIWYMMPDHVLVLGMDLAAMRPVWAAKNDAMRTWPEFVVLLLLLASLFAMTLVDAKTFTIPIWLTWFPALIALVVHPLHAAWVSRAGSVLPRHQQGWVWTIATPGEARWDWVGLSIGGVTGLAIALVLLRVGWIKRSFGDYAEWEAKAHSDAEREKAQSGALAAVPPPEGVPGSDFGVSPPQLPVEGTEPKSEAAPVSSPEMWMAYPHARREMIRELSFLGPCLLLMLVGWYAGTYWGGVNLNQWNGVYNSDAPVPLWLRVLTGVLMGYLIGGGMVWFVRIAGSLAFGKEAMGMGDVHLMAGVGACLGWIDATLGFFGAAFVGLAWAILGRIIGGRFQRMLPYGPFLAVSTLLVVLCKPLIEQGLSRLIGTPVHLPP